MLIRKDSTPFRFRNHLSTAIVMILVAGALLWASVQSRRMEEDYGECVKHGATGQAITMTEAEFLNQNIWPEWGGTKFDHWGWPFECAILRRDIELYQKDPASNRITIKLDSYNLRMMVMDVLVAFLILGTAMFACERLLAWRPVKQS